VRIDAVTIFPEYLAPLRLSLIGRAVDDGLVDLRVHDLRTWTADRHRTVDDTPYGGGPGMLMRPEPWGEALDEILGGPGAEQASEPRLVVPTPGGVPFTQALAHELAAEQWLVFACGRYEGVDQRVLDDAAARADVAGVTEVSLGDYVLNGGEVAVLAIVEAVARLLPGVIGNADSLVDESHAQGLLEAPGYTKPATWRDHDVPSVLLSGDHGRIARWRRDESLRRTAARRPDLLAALDVAALDRHDLALLAELGWSAGSDGRLAAPAPPVADS
jgi:tRNA (guanine37-N1)-methyltransferase